MRVPSSNLLNQAFRLICTNEIQYFRWQSVTNNAIGYDVHVYADPVTVKASVQEVGSQIYQQLGLDWQKHYIKVWTPLETSDLNRGKPPDQIIFAGERYQIYDSDDWHDIDGWDSFLAVRVDSP